MNYSNLKKPMVYDVLDLDMCVYSSFP